MAKIISFQIPKSQREFVRYQQDRGRHFYDKLHQHPQLQLTVVLEGKGQFLSGDYVGRFQAGDVFFLGENAPHVFRSDPEYFGENKDLRSAGDTIFFDFEGLGKAFGELQDLESLKKFSDYSGLCFQLIGRSKELVSEIFRIFENSSGLARFQRAFELLDMIEHSGDELLPLNKAVGYRGFSEKEGSRMDRVMQFLLDNKFQKISLDQTAAVANLSKEAFCRFFKLRTRKTLTQYLQQLRLNESQKLLQETDLAIAEIAFTVGFENLSYFNRCFKSATGLTPKEWRKTAGGTS